MDADGIGWHFSGMTPRPSIPVFTLFGETSAFPDVIHCERVLDRARLHDWVISAHRHRQMSQILQIEAGRAEARVDGRVMVLGPGDWLYIPAQAVHGFVFSQGAEGTVLSFLAPITAGMTPQMSPWLARPQTGRLSDRAAGLIEDMRATHASRGTFRTQRLVGLSHVLLATIAEDTLDGAGPAHPAERHMDALDALIARHLAAGWTARDYAAALHVTTGHLNRIVQAAKGCSLTAHLEAALMAEACRLIAFTRMPLAEIGFRLGFKDPSYFSRRFRRSFGEAPATYRQRIQDS
ncbi:AraC family transcriptional regulator [Paracoccus liaowanqingii]|uniref:AraC family transcriptional regulator n=1 Tax=Paracoccus liaowanqingii TaxID=2560053 RepID=A0A4Z1CTD1_9RHOB|nr:helix-turn-helix domain-containing protein [Paracoccus liaowanqingii]TGN68720.1 AraC family transcriptional regulator [Paracoccus liaowanqingii]